MIDPTNITNFNPSWWQIEEMILFWIAAAGKNGVAAAKCLDNLLQTNTGLGTSPFSIIRNIPDLPNEMKKHGIGCYNNKAKTFTSLVNSGINLRTCSVEDLINLWGIGRKTAFGFIIHSRPDIKNACLDRHILQFLRDKGHVDVPNSSPSSAKKYAELEKLFLDYANKSGMSVAEFDLKLWNEYRRKAKT